MILSKLFQNKKAVYSFEIFPPKPTAELSAVQNTIRELSALSPDYISVTCSAGGSNNAGTAGIAKLVKECGVEPLAHVTCLHSDKAAVEAALAELSRNGVQNILALRGDRIEGRPLSPDFRYASDLVSFIRAQGHAFDIAAACYPEGHPESENVREDIRNLKIKVDAGVSHLNTQLFFDNEDFFRFMELCGVAGIDVPVQAGVMPLVKKNHVDRIVALSGGKIPREDLAHDLPLLRQTRSADGGGIAYATEQIIDLLTSGAAGVHLYVMNNTYVARKITENIGYILGELNQQ